LGKKKNLFYHFISKIKRVGERLRALKIYKGNNKKSGSSDHYTLKKYLKGGGQGGGIAHRRWAKKMQGKNFLHLPSSSMRGGTGGEKWPDISKKENKKTCLRKRGKL